jgi:hypothetical protein
MSEPSSNTPAPDGLIGLATNQGALQADLKHHVEDNNRTINELRSEQAERDEAQDQRITDVETRLSTVLDRIDTVLAAMETTSRNGDTKPKNTAADATPTSPTRRKGEKSQALHARAVEFAEKHGVTPPPKPGNFDTAREYDKKLASWGQQVSTQ